jgi:hypothetical protein
VVIPTGEGRWTVKHHAGTSRRLAAVLVASAAVLSTALTTGCDQYSTPGSAGSTGNSSPTPGGRPGEGSGGTGSGSGGESGGESGGGAGESGTEPTPEGGGETSPVDTPAPPVDNRPVVGNIELSPDNVQCSYVPHGNLDGSDGLTVFAYQLLIGANSLPGPVASRVEFSNGFSTAYTGSPNNQSAAYFQGPIRDSDWGSRLTVRIAADADDRYRETSESDNAIQVTIDLPGSRPSQPIDPLRCGASRA